MKVIRRTAERKIRSSFKPRVAEDMIKKLVFSWDNAAVHKCPHLLAQVSGISQQQRVQIPPHCYDLQQPIEHAHGRFKSEMRKQLNQPNARGQCWWPTNLPQLKRKCEECWEKVTKATVVSKNVERLPNLYAHVAKKSKGNWAPKHLS